MLKKTGLGFTTLVCLALISVSIKLSWAQEDAIVSRKAKLEKAKDYFSIGQLFIKEGNYSAANAEFAKAELMLQDAAITAPEDETGDKTAANTKTDSEKKQVEKAMSYYLEEIKKETSNPDYYYNLAIDYLNKGQFVLAEESFKLVINLNPLDKDACYNLGILYDNYLGNKEKALKYYQQYLNLAPDAPDAPQVKGWMKAIKDANGER
jgi:tetratricopeptide (TPR) repeat protein